MSVRKNLLAISQKIDGKFKAQTKIMVSCCLLLFSAGMYFGARWLFFMCKFTAYLRHNFDLSAIGFTVIHGNIWKFILLSFYIRIQFCRFSRARYNVRPTTQLFCKWRKWIECCFYYSTWAWTCVSTYFLAGNVLGFF